MPIELEAVRTPSTQDLSDLAKIYADRPDWMALPQLAGGPEQPGAQLFGARFNGRLLAAVIAVPQEGHWRLQQLCVRGITRNRGVGSWLLELVVKEASRQGVRCQLEPGNSPEQARALIQKLPAELWTAEQITLAEQ